MKNIFIGLIFIVFTQASVFGQHEEYRFFDLTKKADSCFWAGDNLQAHYYYKDALKIKINEKLKFNKWYNAASVSAQVNKKNFAFKYLNKLYSQDNEYRYLYQISTSELIEDSSFINLWGSRKWNKLVIQADKANSLLSQKIDSNLIELVDELNMKDRLFRDQLWETEKQYGDTSIQVEELYIKMRLYDSLNIKVADSIINIHGFPGIDILGQSGSYKFFLIIQHAELIDQLKYLELVRNKVSQSNLNAGALMLLEDRISLSTKGVQLYGTQTCRDFKSDAFYLCPLENPLEIDKRRFELGVDPFADDAARRKLNWNMEKYIENLPNDLKIYQRDKNSN